MQKPNDGSHGDPEQGIKRRQNESPGQEALASPSCRDPCRDVWVVVQHACRACPLPPPDPGRIMASEASVLWRLGCGDRLRATVAQLLHSSSSPRVSAQGCWLP